MRWPSYVHGLRGPSVLRQPAHGWNWLKRFLSMVGVGCLSFGSQRTLRLASSGLVQW
jgi:hypothetical protein